MKASNKLIIFYKSRVVEPIQKKMIQDGAFVSMEEVDTLLKNYASYDYTSTKEMTTDQLQELIVFGFQFGDMLGLKLDYPDSEYKDLNFER